MKEREDGYWRSTGKIFHDENITELQAVVPTFFDGMK